MDGLDRHERVVFGVHDHRRNAHPPQERRGARAAVVVRRVTKPVERRDEGFVKITDGAHPAHTPGGELERQGSLEVAMRVVANISLKGGDRSEVKNISGFKGVEKALSYEITRQKNLQRRNIKVVQETRHFDEIRNITVSIRSKE